jgi:hypothetical protein
MPEAQARNPHLLPLAGLTTRLLLESAVVTRARRAQALHTRTCMLLIMTGRARMMHTLMRELGQLHLPLDHCFGREVAFNQPGKPGPVPTLQCVA